MVRRASVLPGTNEVPTDMEGAVSGDSRALPSTPLEVSLIMSLQFINGRNNSLVPVRQRK